MGKVFKVKIPVRYAETDQMKVVYYSHYFVWFEVARTELLKSLGFSYFELEKSGYFLPVVESYCRYFKPAIYGSEVEIETEIRQILKNKIIIFDYRVSQDNKILAEGFTKHICINSLRKPIELPLGLVRKMKSFKR